MDLNVMTQLIGSLGFPIAVCSWFMFAQNKQMNEFRTVIENNTKALTQLMTLKGGGIDG